jgi:hypothetical protein
MVVAFVLSIVLAMHAHSLIICKLQLGLHFDSRAANQGIHIESTWARSKAAQVATRTDRQYRDYMGRMSLSPFAFLWMEFVVAFLFQM